ncbi:MAG: type II toxin-antitoxin system HigB family toxin [Prevotellaceae bacterium]|nr:type II toxin-antitoxin system HigB family toxin [Prevotellaceae bacterium]
MRWCRSLLLAPCAFRHLATSPRADCIEKSRYVFNIKGNDYRLVAVVFFVAGQITICFIGTHAEYSKINCLTVLK